jgi:hypothetical protein
MITKNRIIGMGKARGYCSVRKGQPIAASLQLDPQTVIALLKGQEVVLVLRLQVKEE